MSFSNSSVVVDGVTYYGCSGTWYTRRYVSGSASYVVVDPPAGY